MRNYGARNIIRGHPSFLHSSLLPPSSFLTSPFYSALTAPFHSANQPLSQQDAETVRNGLVEASGGAIKAGTYHADVGDEAKERLHRDWREGRVKVVCATIGALRFVSVFVIACACAFCLGGMGIGMGMSGEVREEALMLREEALMLNGEGGGFAFGHRLNQVCVWIKLCTHSLLFLP